MTVEYEPAPRPTPLWTVPATIIVLALALLWVVRTYGDADVGGFGGPALPSTPKPEMLADGSTPPAVPAPLARLFGDDVVLAQRLTSVPDEVEAHCRQHYAQDDGPAREHLHEVVDSADAATTYLGPDALTSVSIATAASPPGHPAEVSISCIARQGDDGWETADKPAIDFALDGRSSARMTDPTLRSRLVQVPVGARWAVQPRGGWWLAYDVRDVTWALVTLNDAIGDDAAMRVTFVDATGDVVADRPVGPTRSAASADHSADIELVAGDVPIVLDRLDEKPIRVCDPSDAAMCVWLAFDDQREIGAFAGFGPHPLDTPPMGYVGYCPGAELLQGSLTTAQFGIDGSWAGGPVDRGLDRYTVRYEANKVVIDLSEHVRGDPAEGDAVEDAPQCTFTGKATGKVPKDKDDNKKDKKNKDDE